MPIWPLPLHATPDGGVRPLTLLGLLTNWQWDWFAGPMLLVLVGVYVWGVSVLRRRGDAWSISRTSYWMIGMAQLAYATLGPLGVYDTVLFSIHMVQHMMLSMTIPVALAQGAPMTLALRVLSGRVRSGLLWLIHSKRARVILFPPLTTSAMILMPFLLYTSGLYDLTLRNAVFHDLLHLWMLLMGSKTLVAESWYLAFNRTGGPSPMRDQYIAGGILWATGDFTMLGVMTALFLGWFRESQREARRVDRQLDREERALLRREQEAGVSGATMQPLPADTRTEE